MFRKATPPAPTQVRITRYPDTKINPTPQAKPHVRHLTWTLTQEIQRSDSNVRQPLDISQQCRLAFMAFTNRSD